ncbi:MAG: bifunctional UDP-N-acetylglucosamine diphosphorylase/glucosamine-1-phosphate N-acetyltransferase GlmU [Proteobacteria bacterium]|jgi:bifunctional UDP-N-acetylglucosamine pyrophosphorylase / glucosamine-1-phosphate N-acetyltransferase|nr:bifunctional UDP-N-acetylglucosamine diphosphorylase/glucosamine-1-phosphate N-acetyltransferase GlmU [Pseudomonadota bacterium]
MSSAANIDVIILAAGQGTRMKSALPKVLHPVGGRALISHVLAAASALANTNLHIVIGQNAEALQQHVETTHPDLKIKWVQQTEQLGTGHAVQQTLPNLGASNTALVLYGDVPLIETNVLSELVEIAARRQLALLTTKLDEPAGYGRIVRDANGDVNEIVEHRDCDDSQLGIDEVNTGFMALPVAMLSDTLAKLENNNDQQEYYLTDVIKLAKAQGGSITGVCTDDFASVLGVNDRRDLAICEKHYQARRALAYMESGVTIVDPDRVTFRGDVSIAPDTSLDINTVIEGPTQIGSHVVIGANSIVRASTLADGCVIEPNCVIEDADVGASAAVGPFARIRPGSELGENVRIGNFVEVKNSKISAGAKANHLSYVGDTDVGANTNIGAGVITCNYDGAYKHRTVIGENVFVGSDCQLVAPVTIADNATIGAGTTVTNDVEADVLIISRVKQRSVRGWKRPTKK